MVRTNGKVLDLFDLGEDAPGWSMVQGFAPCGHGFCALLGRPSGPDVPLYQWGPELVELEWIDERGLCLNAVGVAWERMTSMKAKD